MNDSRKSIFSIGIDLGTTNCALSYIKSDGDPKPVAFEIPQWETAAAIVGHKIFPSFYYLPIKAEWKRGQLRHSWHAEQDTPDYAVGRYAKSAAATQPGRVIHSAKSWICHGGVSRDDRILPWHSDELIGDDRRSPVEVSAAFLKHMLDAWNYAHVGDAQKLEHQIVTITVPASFDETAQALTVRAAELAGIPSGNIHLLEEPQAAFYSWLRQESSGKVIEDLLQPEKPAAEKTILICDIGGGTSDFSLFRVKIESGKPAIERISVSDHLLLGGDNIDLAIAHKLEERLSETKLSSKQWAQLVTASRQLKERALSEVGSGDEDLRVALPGEGSSLFAKTLSAGIKRAEVLGVVLTGFFPLCRHDEFPKVKDTGLRALGLPYAEDSAVTKYLARFVSGKKVDAVLFTGGTLIPKFLQNHLVAALTSWQAFEPKILANDEMDLAVSLGAAAFGATFFESESKPETGITVDRIKAGYPRSLYLELAHKGVSGDRSLLCIVPKGFDGHVPLRIDALKMQALVDAPVRFQLFTSSKRDADQPGSLLKLTDDDFHPLNPLHTVLKHTESARAGKPVEVALEIMLMSTGMLQLSCVNKDGGQRWPLEFNVRDFSFDGFNPAGFESDSQVADDRLAAGVEILTELFGKKKGNDGEQNNPKYLMRHLEEIFGLERKNWDVSTLRRLWPQMKDGMTRKGRSVGHEVSWLYLAGYCLRPGYGVELDEWRVSDLWKAHGLGIAHPKERQVEEQWWIMWRRVAGGLTRDQQEKIFDKVFPAIKKGTVPSPEVYMLAGSLERIEMGNKVRLGSYLVQQIAEGRKQFLDQKLWALGRIASRVLMHGGAESIVRPVFVEEWFKQITTLNIRDRQYLRLANFLAQAGRIVNDREFDVSPATRLAMITMLEKVDEDGTLTAPLRNFVAVDGETKGRLFGEELPGGLILHA